jgi:hypothetical protein
MTGRPRAVNARRPGWIELIAAIVRRAPRLDGARCRGQHELFDADDGPHGEGTAAAIRLCTGCPALGACQQWAETLHHAYLPRGVLAGRWRAPLWTDERST